MNHMSSGTLEEQVATDLCRSSGEYWAAKLPVQKSERALCNLSLEQRHQSRVLKQSSIWLNCQYDMLPNVSEIFFALFSAFFALNLQ